MALAVNCGTSSSLLTPKASQKHLSCSLGPTPFLGFSLAASYKPSVLPKRLFTICCQEKSVSVPVEQQWMFDDLTGPDVWNKTWYPKAKDHVQTSKPWYIVDATDKMLGRLASTMANHIRGKNLATYNPSVDIGAFVKW